MSKQQLNIFDQMMVPLKEKKEKLTLLKKQEESMLSSLDPSDYEDRNEIYSCNKMIESYEHELATLEQELAEIRSLSDEINKMNVKTR